ncbi:hypothetical protein [Hyphomonas sp.]|uniref:hypothetical protein n=1 Tax=Hyphomonas sp. TaxID=87 RepID=UPI00391B52E8
MEPQEPEQTRKAETVETERVSGSRRVGLWKILAASLVIVVLGFAVIAGMTMR